MQIRAFGRALFALAGVVGLGAPGCSSEAEGHLSALCAEDDCPRGAPCGCVGRDAECSCDQCQQVGQCYLVDGVCMPASEDDCNRPNGACATYGLCHLGSNLNGAVCVPESDDDCKGSTLCTKYGACAVLEGGQQCAVGSDDDCASSDVCAELGCCGNVDSECVRSDGTCPLRCCGEELC